MMIWTGWLGERPPYIDYCLKTIRERSGMFVRVLDDLNIKEYIYRLGICDKVLNLSRPAQVMDCVRVALLNVYGGLWIDADTIVLKELAYCLPGAEEKGFAMVRDERTQVPYNGYMGARPRSEVTRKWICEINHTLQSMDDVVKASIQFHKFGSDMMQGILTADNHSEWPMKWFFPFNFSDGNGKVFYGNSKIEDHLTPDTLAIALSNSWLSSQTGGDHKKSLDELCVMDNLFGSILRYSLRSVC